MQGHDPVFVQLDPKCLHSALKEFFEPLRTNNSRADFFAVYRKESDVFDREHMRKYDEDLNTSLIFAGLFSAVSSAFIIDVQSNLQPDPTEKIAAYMQVLIHAVNGSLFPDADPNAATWTGPPSDIVIVQSLLYASLATSLFAAFMAMLAKQWINRYLRNRGGSAAEKSRDRQRKLDGLEGWHLYLVVESLPLMLQFALLLLGCALSRYLWTINHTVAGLILAFTLLGVLSYVFFTIAASLSYNCPYQTPFSILHRIFIEYMAHNETAFVRSLRSLMTTLAGVSLPRGILRQLHSGARHVVRCLGRTVIPLQEATEIPLAAVATPIRIFEETNIDWEGCKADARCIAWLLYSSTDIDVIHSTVQFAADTIWYPEIAQALSPHILTDLLFECLLDGRVAPDKSEHATSIGMALASILSIQLSMGSVDEDLKLRELRERINSGFRWAHPIKSTFGLVAMVLKLVVWIPSPDLSGTTIIPLAFASIPEGLPTTYKLWLSRVMLQTVWRWRRVQDPTTVLLFQNIEFVCKRLMADGDQTLILLKTNCVLTMAISLGLTVDMCDLYAPVDKDALETAIHFLHDRLRTVIREGTEGGYNAPYSILPALSHFHPSQVAPIGELCFSWITDILNSKYAVPWQYRLAGEVVELAWKHINYQFQFSKSAFHIRDAWIPPLLGFLQLSEEFYATDLPLAPAAIALRIVSIGDVYDNLVPTVLPILISTLLPTHPLKSRRAALKIFSRWFSTKMGNVLDRNRARLLQAVGDPFQFTPDLPPLHQLTDEYEPMDAAVNLIVFASSDLWKHHLRHLNFTSCEDIISTEEGRSTALRIMSHKATWLGILHTPAGIIAAIKRLEELQCPNTAEVVLMWAWMVWIVNDVDHDAWWLIGHKTLAFYQTHGIGRLRTLSRQIMIGSTYRPPPCNPQPCQADGVRSPARVAGVERLFNVDLSYSLLARMCRLRRLYQLFGCSSLTMWNEMVAEENVEEVSVARSGAPPQFMDYACDYP